MGSNQKLAKLKSQEYAKRITNKKPMGNQIAKPSSAGPMIIGFFAFVIIGSALFQIIGAFMKTADK